MASKTDEDASPATESHPEDGAVLERTTSRTSEWPNMRKGADGVFRLPTAKKLIYASPMVGYYAMKYMRCAWPKLRHRHCFV
eukprot:SAG31_NODE_27524_length_424_cov_1.738462_1_plen_82_part_00